MEDWNGNVVRIGLDPWIGCKWRHVLPSPMLEKLHLAGFYFIYDIGLLSLPTLISQQWLNVETIGFSDP